MNAVKLSICIATLADRDQHLVNMLKRISPDWCEVLIDFETDCLGDKRQRILEQAVGEYVAVIDDDDEISDNYFDVIKTGIESGSDIICIGLDRHEDGVFVKTVRAGFENPFDGERSGFNHFCPVKRKLALESGYRSIGWGEDIDFCSGLEIEKIYYTQEIVYIQKYVTREKEYNKFENMIEYCKKNPRIYKRKKKEETMQEEKEEQKIIPTSVQTSIIRLQGYIIDKPGVVQQDLKILIDFVLK